LGQHLPVRDLFVDFDGAWGERAALSTDEAIAYAQRGRGERKRRTSGWKSLTPTEREVVRLVSEGLANKDIATRLFVSPRTVQTHLSHVFAKLGLKSRVQLVQEAGRHAWPTWPSTQRRSTLVRRDVHLWLCSCDPDL
jgi:DNA-binding CsgD family transcriptional regulator